MRNGMIWLLCAVAALGTACGGSGDGSGGEGGAASTDVSKNAPAATITLKGSARR